MRRPERRISTLAAGFFLLLSACQGEGQASPQDADLLAFPQDADLLALIKERVEKGGATGIVLGVREADGTHRVVSFGDPGPGALPLGPKSVFEIGSISKVFTGILLAEMAGRGEVSLDDPIQAISPRRWMSRPGTVSRFAWWISPCIAPAFPALPENFSPADATNPYADYSVAQLYEFLSGHELTTGHRGRVRVLEPGYRALGPRSGHGEGLRTGRPWSKRGFWDRWGWICPGSLSRPI